jgi:hypothetical protein
MPEGRTCAACTRKGEVKGSWVVGSFAQPCRKERISKVCLSALPVYLLTALKVPKQFARELDKTRRRFLWAGDQELTGGKCKVSWLIVSKPIDLRGLGILDLQKFSRALRLRWLWFVWTCPEQAWNGMELAVDDIDRTLFAAATRVQIHNGKKKALFWHSSWLDVNHQHISSYCCTAIVGGKTHGSCFPE